jgi:HSP20 family protein
MNCRSKLKPQNRKGDEPTNEPEEHYSMEKGRAPGRPRAAGGRSVRLLQHRMNGLFIDVFGRSFSGPWPALSGGFAPQTEVSETGKEVRISAELPGLDEKDVEVTVAGQLLTIKGEKKA